MKFQSTRPVWGATPIRGGLPGTVRISIHAPRVGRDFGDGVLHAGDGNFNPRAPCGARPKWYPFGITTSGISIHAPRVGRDDDLWAGDGHAAISIHAPRVGRDLIEIGRMRDTPHFNPRAPCGARRQTAAGSWMGTEFQSTRPVWGATKRSCSRQGASWISIHAPRVGRDAVISSNRASCAISIHAPRVGRDRATAVARMRMVYFNPRAPCGARPHRHAAYRGRRAISIHAPRVGRDFPSSS